MTPNVRLDHCVVHVSDWPRSNAFYRDVLGAELVGAGAGWSYRFGEQQLNVYVPGVAHHVGWRLLCPVVDGHLHRGRQRRQIFRGLRPHRQPSSLGAVSLGSSTST